MIETNNLVELLPWKELIESLNDIFQQEYNCPIRHHHGINVPGSDEATLLLMPSWIDGQYIGVKQVNVFPGNHRRGMPGLSSHYLLSSGETGELLARLDGNVITARRTAAASALGTRYLSRPDSKRLLMVGAGRVARNVVPATASIRPIEHVDVWDISEDNAEKFVSELEGQGYSASRVDQGSLEEAVGQADIISCATLSKTPLILGDWVKEGTHVDLIGSFTPKMREADDTLMSKAHVFADFREAALQETGDLSDPIRSGAISEASVEADFIDLSKGVHAGRAGLLGGDKAITVFKAVGSSIEDLAAAILAYNKLIA